MSEPTLAERSVELVRTWIDPSRPAGRRPDATAARLSAVLDDPRGVQVLVAYVDRVVRPEDPHVAAAALRALARDLPGSLPWSWRARLRLGALLARVSPAFVASRARRGLARVLRVLSVDPRPEQVGPSLARLRSRGERLDLHAVGGTAPGDAEAARRRDRVAALIARDDVDRVSLRVASVTSRQSLWAFDESVARAVAELTPLYRRAATGEPTFITLDMEEYGDLDLTIAVFTTILDDFPDLEAGIVLQACLPDALGAMQELQAWATRRRDAGGAPVTVRVVRGAALTMERVDAIIHGWPLATFSTEQETDTNVKRLLDWALTPTRIDAVRIGVASRNLFDIAWAWLLAGDRGVRDGVHVEMLSGADRRSADAVRADVGSVVLHAPVLDPDDPATATPYLVGRLAEAASDESFPATVSALATDPSLLARETDRFLTAVKHLDLAVPAPHRRQDRLAEIIETTPGAFRNTPDTDPSVEANREWIRLVAARSSYTQVGAETVRAARVPGPASLATILHDTRAAARAWEARGSEVRAWILHQAAGALAARRGDLVSVMAAEAGTTIAEADAEVSAAVDLAGYYAESARRLDAVDGARFVPDAVTVVTPPWSSPVATAAGSVLAALGTGSGVVLKPARRTRRCAAVVVEALWQAGVPRDVLRLVTIDEEVLGATLVSHPDVDRVLLAGEWATARQFRSWRPDLPLLAATGGRNAVVVTPSADVDLAVADLVESAFGRAGQDCAAASLAILVGTAAESERFRQRLVDAAASLTVGHPDEPSVTMGPVAERSTGRPAEDLTSLGDGESWLLQPRQVGTDSRLWTPGIRTGVLPGSRFHTSDHFGPVLGLMHAANLDEAIAWQNATEHGLAAGLHSLDADEIATWIDRVEAGNLHVNRRTTGAVVQRQPLGGWGRSSIGATGQAGGPNYLTHLGTWRPRPLRATTEHPALAPVVEALLTAAAPHLSPSERDAALAAARSDQTAWAREYGVAKDVSRLGVERNLLRYVPVAVTIRFDGRLPDLVRVLLAAARTGAPIIVSSGTSLPPGLVPGVTVETHEQWLAHAAATRPARVRLVGSDARELAVALDGDPDVAVHSGDVTPAGRVEALPFLQEQSISLTNHRFGHHDPMLDGLLPRR